jgi:hypothetical protein
VTQRHSDRVHSRQDAPPVEAAPAAPPAAPATLEPDPAQDALVAALFESDEEGAEVAEVGEALEP